jgi:hypothetical protein
VGRNIAGAERGRKYEENNDEDDEGHEDSNARRLWLRTLAKSMDLSGDILSRSRSKMSWRS